MAIACLAAAAVATVTAPFGTSAMPPGQRAAFWALLMGWSLIKWGMWFAWRVRDAADWFRAAALGALVLNLLVPLEVKLALQAVGIEATISPLSTFLSSLVIAAALALVLWAAVRRRGEAPEPVSAQVADGLLARARVAPDDVHAVRAEDHFCRLYLADGGERLILYRFGDAVKELAGLDGARVHRGAWIASAAVLRAERRGRRWHVVLRQGLAVAVSASHTAEVRRRGWLRP